MVIVWPLTIYPMKTRPFSVLIFFLTYLISIGISHAQVVTPITADAYTVILDHFDGATSAEKVGSVAYVPGIAGLNQAVDLSAVGAYLIFRETTRLNATGTVELWFKLKSFNQGLININWNKSYSYPSAGHVFHLRIDAAGKVSLNGWPNGNFLSNSVVPLNEWTHLAVSWGDSSNIYINGKLDYTTKTIFTPSINTSNYVYLPYWGGGAGYFDELHISSNQRSQDVIASRIPPPIKIVQQKFRQDLTASAGSAKGSGGSSSYTVGQLIASNVSGKNGSVIQGIEIPVEIWVVTGLEVNNITLDCVVYPNPALDFLQLKVAEWYAGKLRYQLIDLNGKLLVDGMIQGAETTIGLSQLAPSFYFLKISDSKKVLKTFKILKK